MQDLAIEIENLICGASASKKMIPAIHSRSGCPWGSPALFVSL
ncbi:hypothetical protein SCG7109_AX_00070 [Chlamydiales bacterium SCGC AG-110-M15]|nr:hypothetical protein SCG7109_AX_00070 [Chlamydiales bacterium SCGC AG-110-M15]